MEIFSDEAKQLAERGVKRTCSCSSGTMRYGEDLYGEPKLEELLDKLAETSGAAWIRILYCYRGVTDKLLGCDGEARQIVNIWIFPFSILMTAY